MEDKKNEKIKINMVKTNKGCFINDCEALDGYSYNYHHSKLKNLYFDGILPSSTFSPMWLFIKKYPETITEKVTPVAKNRKYVLIDKTLASTNLPEIIPCEDRDKYPENIFCLYSFMEDKQDDTFEKVDCTINIILEVENFEFPEKINYSAITTFNWSNKQINITNVDINHQLFDKIIFPDIMLHTRPCSISSQDLYSIVRQYIKTNIDNKYAKIEFDYDFCFAVTKIIPLIEPQTVSYQNIFAKTKKERVKIKYVTKSFKEVQIFEMTHSQSKYKGYTILDEITANNEKELKEKIDEFLETLITIINKPLNLCEHCNGTGYKDDIKKTKINSNTLT